jgi:hypothetical protein
VIFLLAYPDLQGYDGDRKGKGGILMILLSYADEVRAARIFVLIVLACIVYHYTIGTWRREKKEEKYQKWCEEKDQNRRKIEEKWKAEERAKLLTLREVYYQGIVEKNERHLKMDGRIWQDEDKAMLEYDDRHRKEWEEAGMTPPSFVKKGT